MDVQRSVWWSSACVRSGYQSRRNADVEPVGAYCRTEDRSRRVGVRTNGMMMDLD